MAAAVAAVAATLSFRPAAIAPAHACCDGGGAPYTAQQQKFIDDTKAIGVTGAGGHDSNIFSAGYILCQGTYYGGWSPSMMDTIQRIIDFQDFNQIRALAKQDLYPDGPI
jgi:hypothetical protein